MTNEKQVSRAIGRAQWVRWWVFIADFKIRGKIGVLQSRGFFLRLFLLFLSSLFTGGRGLEQAPGDGLTVLAPTPCTYR
ncbi:MAG: hypothetical protein VX100_17655, partial [Pseudomonadota bacterium]|nr:hypothetical protein [Pseudomonadota bacterium]